MARENLSLTKQHFSTKVYKAYFHYIRTFHPHVNLVKLCQEAGLSYEYVANESNWVSTVFDNRITHLMIEQTGEPDLCYKAGKQQISEEVMGKVVYYIMRYAVSLQFVFSQLPQLTSLFSKVTQVHLAKQKRAYVHLRLTALTAGLTQEEQDSLQKNMNNIFQNTIGHYTAVPSCQDLPLSKIEYTRSADTDGLPIFDIHIYFFSNWKKAFEALVPLLLLLTSILVDFWGSKFFPQHTILLHWVAGALFFGTLIVIGFVKYTELKRGFNISMTTLNKMDERYAELHKTKERFEQLSVSYHRFVPQEFLKLLGHENVIDINLGDSVEIEATILFSDIRNFTSLSEQMKPRENFLFLNSYLARISPCIRQNGGFIDKYVGDGIMAIFPQSPRDAILASVSMIQELRKYNYHRSLSGYDPVKIGVGLNTGRVVLGTIGNKEQMDGTVISSCVNIASRLEQLNKHLGSSIIVTQDTLDRSGLADSLLARRLGKIPIRGKKENVAVVEIFAGETEMVKYQRLRTKNIFHEGIDSLEQGRNAESREKFEQVLRLDPNDSAARYFMHQADENLVAPAVVKNKAA